MKRFSLVAVLAGSLMLVLPAAADAQDGASRKERDARASDGALPAVSKEFTAEVKLPFLHNSSVIPANIDGSGIDQPDWVVSPELILRWSRQLADVRISASGAIIMDRYRQVTSADLNTLEATLKAYLTDGRSDLFVPYASLIANSYYDREFRSLDDRRQDIAVGFYSGIGMRDGKTIPYRSVKNAGDRAILLDLQAGYRLASDANLEHWFVDGLVDLIYVLRSDISLVFQPKVRARWYDDYFGVSRNDIRVGGKAMLVWEPNWLKTTLPDSEVELSVEYLKNFSNEPTARYSLWEFGPTLILKTRF